MELRWLSLAPLRQLSHWPARRTMRVTCSISIAAVGLCLTVLPAGCSRMETYKNPAQGFSFSYDPNRFELTTPQPQRILLRFVLGGPAYHGSGFAVALFDRKAEARPAPLMISVVHATTPISLPSLSVLRRADKLLFVSIDPIRFRAPVYAVGSSGTRAVVATTLSGWVGVKTSVRERGGRSVFYWLHRGNVLCAINLRATDSEWSEIGPALNAIVDSFSIK
jgi:hypothetical protein